MASSPRIALFVDRPDWHARRLIAAFRTRGVEPVTVPFRESGFAVGQGAGLDLPGFDGGLPDGAFVRFLPAGSFEQVTVRLGLLHALRESGVPVWNDARAIERCVDKSMTSFMLQRAGLPTPDSWVFDTFEGAAAVVAREADAAAPLVLKPLFGSQGRGLRLIERVADLPPEDDLAGVYYLQRFLRAEGAGWRDVRVFVAGDQPIAAMVRHGKRWITNVHQGADVEALRLDDTLSRLAVDAAAAVGAGYAGVDILRDERGRPWVLEVNSMPAWSALQKVSDVNVAQVLVDGFLAVAVPDWAGDRDDAPPLEAAGG